MTELIQSKVVFGYFDLRTVHENYKLMSSILLSQARRLKMYLCKGVWGHHFEMAQQITLILVLNSNITYVPILSFYSQNSSAAYA